ncbi:DNA primase [Alteromonas ponticola]|uniref:DNA primase n=1 Tax=Alteromonas aquimaris TaxID=2998417 RepID=A0ABT3PBC8_9ALTE|nr:DNA primase [Alteromonas aquimaris]MCW8109396.1 DNA primase [Alteromonas aquimaris]
MAGKIPRDFIDDLLSRTDVVDIVDSRVQLKKAGKNYQACCPFHNEKTPSFTVSQEKQFYHCFGCGAHGNAISFLMEFDRMEFVEAIEELAKINGVEVPREKSSGPFVSEQAKQQKQDDFAVMEQVTRFFQHQLKHHTNSPNAIEYLKQRGLSGEIVKQWEIGYAPSEWDGVLSKFGTSNERIQQLLDLKLITQNDNGKRYDFFRDRIMFPIRDRRGRVVGFGGRVLSDGGPKYLNSPETRIFHKGQELFGFYQAKNKLRHLDYVMVVEGYMDVVALSQFEINNATAALGTATTPEHLSLLMRSTSTIVCCYDGDRAGRDAAWRALENALPVLKDGVSMKFLFLPDGEDPDTMVRKVGKTALEALIEQAQPLSHFFFESMLKQHQVGTPEGKLALKTAVKPYIEKVLGDNQRALLEEELAKHTGEYDRFRLQQDIRLANSKSAAPSQGSRFQNVAKTEQSPARMLLRLLLENPHFSRECNDVNPVVLQGSGLSGIDLLIEVFNYCHQQQVKSTAQIIEYFRDHPHSSVINKLLVKEQLVSDADAKKVYRGSFAKLLDWHFDSRIETLLSRARIQKLSDEEKAELTLLMKERKN